MGTNNPVMLSFIMYILWIILPMVPSVIIYKIFPDSKVGMTGVLANLKINATGAFGAYLIILVTASVNWLGNVQTLIPNTAYQTWKICAVLRYVDANGNLLPDQDSYIKQTKAEIEPLFEAQTPKQIRYIATGIGREITTTFSCQDSGFSTATLDLLRDKVKIEGSNIIALDTLVMIKNKNTYNSSDKSLIKTNSGPPLANR